MKYKSLMKVVLAGGMLLLPATCNAQSITVTGEPCPIRVETLREDVEGVSELTEFELYGLAAGDQYLISYADEESGTKVYGYVKKEELEAELPELDYSALFDGSALETVGIGSEGEMAKAVQESLITLEYLYGSADGSYGNGTASAVREFQEKYGLESTGDVDTITRLVMEDAVAAPEAVEVVYPQTVSTGKKFEKIIGEISEEELENYAGSEWKLTYDAFERTGALDPSVEIGELDIESPAVDRISLKASLQVILADQGEGLQTIPAIVIESAGVYRPYVTGVAVMANGIVYKNDGAVLSGSVDSATVTEFAYVPLTEEILSVLGEGGISLRVNGKNKDYDLNYTADEEKVATFVSTVQ